MYLALDAIGFPFLTPDVALAHRFDCEDDAKFLLGLRLSGWDRSPFNLAGDNYERPRVEAYTAQPKTTDGTQVYKR
jgi:hypothetical protein